MLSQPLKPKLRLSSKTIRVWIEEESKIRQSEYQKRKVQDGVIFLELYFIVFFT